MPVYEEKTKVNGQKRYFIRTYVKDINGNRKQITKHNKDWIGREGKKEAEWEENRIKHKITTFQKDLFVSVIIEEYIDSIKNNLKKSTITRYTELYKIYLFPFFKNIKTFELTPKDILEWKNTFIENKVCSLETRQKAYNLLSSSLDYAIVYYGLEMNLCRAIPNFKLKNGETKKVKEILTLEEFKRFIDFEEDEIYKDFLSLLYFTGLRRGELLSLTASNINFEERCIKIDSSINPKNGVNPTAPKTYSSNRTIPLTSEAYNILVKYKHIKGIIFGLDKIKVSTLDRKCKRNCKSANINKYITPHCLRHSFATMCNQLGIDNKAISNYLGHSSTTTTNTFYIHILQEDKQKLVDNLNGYFLKQDQKQDQNDFWQTKTLENQGLITNW